MAILRLPVRNDIAEWKRVNFALGEFLEEEGLTSEGIHRVRLVVEELLVNVIRHAFDDKASHSITLDVRTEPSQAVIVIEDDGRAFDPRQRPEPELGTPRQPSGGGGLGIYIVKRMTSDLDYTRENNRNRVRAVVKTS